MVIIGIAGALAAVTLSKSGASDVEVACAVASAVSLASIVLACIVYTDRNDVLSRYRRAFRESGTEDQFVKSYRAGNSLKAAFIAVLAVVAVVLSGYSLTAGIGNVSISEAFGLVVGHLRGIVYEAGSEDWFHDILIWNSQLPKTLVAVVAGAGLAIGGAVMQSVLKNPLADPYTTGISSGAVLGANIAIVLGLTVVGLGQYGLVLNAFLFSLIPAGVMIFVSRISSGSPATIILVGTAVTYIFSAFSTLIMMVADDDAMQEAYEWQVGSLSGASWSYLPMMAVVTLVGCIVLYAMSGRLNLLMMGDNDAKALGLNVDNFRMLCLIIISLVTASIVSFVGMIGFLGLIAPHMVRLVLGSDTRLVIPASAMVGVVLILLADVLSRILATSTMPVGVVLSFIGAPLFLLMVMRTRREAWERWFSRSSRRPTAGASVARGG